MHLRSAVKTGKKTPRAIQFTNPLRYFAKKNSYKASAGTIIYSDVVGIFFSVFSLATTEVTEFPLKA